MYALGIPKRQYRRTTQVLGPYMSNPINPVKNTRESYDRFYQKNITEVLVQFGNEDPAWIPYDTVIAMQNYKNKQ